MKSLKNTHNYFTVEKLVEYLNKKHKTKDNGTPFTGGDVQQYLRRGNLPKSYGHHEISREVLQDVLSLIHISEPTRPY